MTYIEHLQIVKYMNHFFTIYLKIKKSPTDKTK
jgi:hypothetical protein